MTAGRIVDLPRVRAARVRLDRLALARPELIGPVDTLEPGALAADWLAILQHDLDAMTDAQTYSLAEVAALAGIGVETVRRAIRAGDLAALHLPRNYRVSRVELARWWASRGGGQLFDDVPAPVKPSDEEPSR